MTEPTMVQRDFDGVLALLLEWNGRWVAVGIDGPGDGGLATLRGRLTAGREMADPIAGRRYDRFVFRRIRSAVA